MPRLKITVLLLCWSLAGVADAAVSGLWGTNGELWRADGRLPDFSYAGYHRGEQPLPDVPEGVSVKTFGAKGDGVADDTAAFLEALATVKKGAIEVPPGRYVITNILQISRSGIVLRGAGPDKTVLFFPRPLQAVKPDWNKTTTGRRASNYSWAGGFVWFKGDSSENILADVIAPAERGETWLQLSTNADLRAGQCVEIRETDNPDNSLAVELYSGDAGSVTNLQGVCRASLVCRIVQIDGPRIRVDRPLRVPVRGQWHPRVYAFQPTVTEAGVENLALEFPHVPYPGHFNEMGYNGVAFSNAADCWARNLVISNADGGIFPGGRFCTMENIIFDCGRPADPASDCTGHHGVDFTGDDNLLAGFDFHMKFIHDLSVEHCAAGNVIANGHGVDLCFDHHVCAPYENLYTDIDAGAGTRLWKCGGGTDLGKHCGARGTFWNIRAKTPQKYPPADFGPSSMNFIAIRTTEPSDVAGRWFEAIAPINIVPRDIHAAQLDRRLGRP